MLTRNKVESAMDAARVFIENSILKIAVGEDIVYAFPAHPGKNRITEWGGTSSALSCLYSITPTPHVMNHKLESAQKWLLQKQSSEGAWNAAQMFCCEATSAVLSDIYSLNILDENATQRALDFINSCFDDEVGCFCTVPIKTKKSSEVVEEPHLYTTYLAVKTLSELNKLKDSQARKVEEWISNTSISKDGCWGATRSDIRRSVPHTVFALSTLMYCGAKPEQILQKYRKQIKWLRKQVSKSENVFETEKIRSFSERDEDGNCEFLLSIVHFNAALLCNFFIKIDEITPVQKLIKIMLDMQEGGWGDSSNRRFIWATQQAVSCLKWWKDHCANNTPLKRFINDIPYFGLKFTIAILLCPIVVWVLKDAGRIESFVLSIVVLILPWLFKIEY